MKNALLCMLTILAVSGVATADSVCVNTVMVVSSTPGLSFSCGNLIFSNFEVTNLSGVNNGTLDITSVTVSSNGTVTLNENANLGSGGHMDLWFEVSGGVSNIGLSVGGSLASVTERVCANPIPTATGMCMDSSGTNEVNPLGQLTVGSLDPNQPVIQGFKTTNPVYVFKDIGAGSGGSLNNLNEEFSGAGANSVPEPVTFVLIGSALAFLGITRRYRARKS